MRIRNVQCLRALAAILVIGVHAGRVEERAFASDSWLASLHAFGNAGVDLFFVISGFIMITTTWDQFGVPRASLAFLSRRIERIYPLYWIVMLAYIVLHAAAPEVEHLAASSGWALVASFLLLPQLEPPMLIIAWTLICEMFFYLAFALALGLRRTHGLTLLAGWAVLTVVLNVVQPLPHNALALQLGSPFNLEFAFGVVLGIAVTTRRIVAPAAFLAAGTVALAGAWVALIGASDVPSVWFRIVAFGLPMAAIVYGLVGVEVTERRRLPQWLAAIGDASYSLYLWHGLLIAVFTAGAAKLHPHGALAHGAYVAAMYAFTIAGAVVLYRAIERPLLRFLHKPGRHRALIGAPGSS